MRVDSQRCMRDVIIRVASVSHIASSLDHYLQRHAVVAIVLAVLLQHMNDVVLQAG